MRRPILLAAFAFLGSALMSGEVILTNRSQNPWTLQRVAQAHEAMPVSQPTSWDDLALGAGVTERLDLHHPGTYLFKLLDVNQVSFSTIKIIQPEVGEVRLVLSWDEASGASTPLHPVLCLEASHQIAIIEAAFTATPLHPDPFLFQAPVPPPAPSTSSVHAPAKSSPLPCSVEPMGRPLSLPPSTPGAITRVLGVAPVDSDAEVETKGVRDMADSRLDRETADTCMKYHIHFPFNHADEGDPRFAGIFVVFAGSEVIGQFRCEAQKSEIRTGDRFRQVSFNASGLVKMHREGDLAPEFPIVLQTCAYIRPTGYFAPMTGHKGNYVKLQSARPRSKATSANGRLKASELKIRYELRVPGQYADRPITIEYLTRHRHHSNQTGWRLAPGGPDGWSPILHAEVATPTSPISAARPQSPVPAPPLSSTPIPSLSSSVSSASGAPGTLHGGDNASPVIPADLPSKPPLVRSLRYIRHTPGITLDDSGHAKVIDTKDVIRLFQQDQVLLVDLGNDNREGFAGHMETMLFIWARTMDTVRDAGGSAGYSSWREAVHSHVRALLQPETQNPLPSPNRVRRDDTEHMKCAPGLIGYTVVWSRTNSHVIIGKISEGKEFEEKAWWTEHAGKPLTLETAVELLKRFVFHAPPGRGRWVSFIPVLPELRTQPVDHYLPMPDDREPL